MSRSPMVETTPMETGPGHEAAAAPTPTTTPAQRQGRDARAVVALSMVSIATLLAAYALGYPWLGLAVLGGANLLAWLVVIQGRRA
jgi:hypothetical protein